MIPNIVPYPCDLCKQPGVGYLTVPRKRYRLKPHSCAAALKLPVSKLWVCEHHKRKFTNGGTP